MPTGPIIVIGLWFGHSYVAVANEKPQLVGLCQLLTHPDSCNHKLIRVTAEISGGFEEFEMVRELCDGAMSVWLEYGGHTPANVTYCCKSNDPTTRPNGHDPLWIDGIQTSLRQDTLFHRFDKLTQQLPRGQTVKVTIIGRYFSGAPENFPDGRTVRQGFGHTGGSSLLVVQQAFSVSDPRILEGNDR